MVADCDTSIDRPFARQALADRDGTTAVPG
jgi:hypothetical protein